MSSLDTWKFLAGLGLFLYGINLMEQVTRRLAGRSFKLFLRHNTNNLFKAIFGGTVITGIIQSSSVVILMLMSFVGAGVISFRNALGVLVGSNLGTTVDSWFYATIGFKFNIQSYSLPIIAIAGILMFFTEKRKHLYDSLYFVFSIGILLLGFGFMKEGAEQLVSKFNLTVYANFNLFFALLAGFIITVLIQSSSATIVIVLTALNANALSFAAAASVIIGSEVGTTIKFLLTGLKGSSERRKLAWGDFIFNLFTVVISFSFLSWIIYFIREMIGIRDPLIGLVFFQSFINLVSLILFLPFIPLLSRGLDKMFGRGKKGNGNGINLDLPVIPGFSAAVLKKAGFAVLQRVIDFHKKIFGTAEPSVNPAFFPKLKAFMRVHGTTDKEYNRIKEMEGDVLKYYTRLQKDDLSKEDYENVNRSLTAIRHALHAAKSVHDILHDLKLFQSSANNYLFDRYALLQNDWIKFHAHYQELQQEENELHLKAGLEKLMEAVVQQFQLYRDKIEQPLTSRDLDEQEISTLLNVHQEILSSQKALLRSLALLKLNKEVSESMVKFAL
ncbi:MAG TPA: Na/Pi symporter [Ferruginibacter sp.]|nr:Na/Pi symporter [Ferruginibacter sp.]